SRALWRFLNSLSIENVWDALRGFRRDWHPATPCAPLLQPADRGFECQVRKPAGRLLWQYPGKERWSLPFSEQRDQQPTEGCRRIEAKKETIIRQCATAAPHRRHLR